MLRKTVPKLTGTLWDGDPWAPAGMETLSELLTSRALCVEGLRGPHLCSNEEQRDR